MLSTLPFLFQSILSAEIAVKVGGAGNVFTPASVNAAAGDIITFTFAASTHNLVQSAQASCTPLQGGLVYPSAGGLATTGATTKFTVKDNAYFFCNPHCQAGMKFEVKVASSTNNTAPATTASGNIAATSVTSSVTPTSTSKNSGIAEGVSFMIVALGALLI